MSLLQGADPWDPGGPKGAFGARWGEGGLGDPGGGPKARGIGPLGVIPRPFRMEGHAKGPKGAWDTQRAPE